MTASRLLTSSQFTGWQPQKQPVPCLILSWRHFLLCFQRKHGSCYRRASQLLSTVKYLLSLLTNAALLPESADISSAPRLTDSKLVHESVSGTGNQEHICSWFPVGGPADSCSWLQLAVSAPGLAYTHTLAAAFFCACAADTSCFCWAATTCWTWAAVSCGGVSSASTGRPLVSLSPASSPAALLRPPAARLR